MARIESTARLGYVPTPDCVVDSVAALLNIPPSCVALDPCCGTGAALAQLAPNSRLYGIELEVTRAREAARTLRHVIAGAMQDARVTNGTFGLVFANPPYDASTEGRLEKVFLERCLAYLCDGGILVWIIKVEQYGPCENLLRRHFDVLGHWRFPDGYFDGPHLAFGQSVLIARKRAEPNLDTKPLEFREQVLRLNALEPLPDFRSNPPTTRFTVPVGIPPKLFHPGNLSDADIESLLKTSPVPRQAIKSIVMRYGRPPMPLKQGHLSLVLASGAIDGVYGSLGDPLRPLHVSKGTVVRQVKQEQVRDRTDSGRAVVIETKTNTFAVKIRTLRPDGSINDLLGAPEEAKLQEGEEEAV